MSFTLNYADFGPDNWAARPLHEPHRRNNGGSRPSGPHEVGACVCIMRKNSRML